MRVEDVKVRFFTGLSRYRWLGTLGRGGMGIVFKAHDLELDEVVAMKVLSPVLEDEEKALLLRFKREINLNRKIKHPNVARIYDFGTNGEYPYITMEFVPGRDLWTIVHHDGPVPQAQAVSILRQIALGSHAAHTLGIVHRDLKSQNIMVNADGGVAILDYGLARGFVVAEKQRITLTATFMGTPQYISPEQALGHDADARSDIYSIGIIAWELLTGQVPFSGPSPIGIGMQHLSAPLPDTLSKVPGISPQLVAIVYKALAKAPESRFQTCADLEVHLALLSSGAEIKLPPSVAAERAKPAEPASDSKTRIRKGRSTGTIKAVPAEPPAEAPKTTVRRRSPLVLVVDDDPEDLAKLCDTLVKAGCDTVVARSATETLELLLKKRVDLVILDAQLKGGMDGFDVARVIKSQPDFRALPILLTTAKLERNQFAFGIQAGAAELLGKPIAAGTLSAKVWKLLKLLGYESPAEREQAKEAVRATLRDVPPPRKR